MKYQIRPVQFTLSPNGKLTCAQCSPDNPKATWSIYKQDHAGIWSWIVDCGSIDDANMVAKALRALDTQFLEVVAEIGYEVGYRKKRLSEEDSRENISAIIAAAYEFDTRHADTVWGEEFGADYIETIDEYISTLI